MAIQLVQGFKTKCQNRYKALPGCDNLGMKSEKCLIIKLPGSGVLKLLARFIFLVLFICSFHWIGPILGRSLNFDLALLNGPQHGCDSVDFDLLSLLFRDLKNEGILKLGDKALLLSNGDEDAIYNSQILIENQMDIISATDFERQNAIPSEIFDFVFTNNFHAAAEFIDRTLKVGGVAAIAMAENPSLAFEKPLNYKIVYLRRLDTNIMAIRKLDNIQTNPATRRRLLSTLDEKKAALNNLEDVLLEPPRSASRRSRKYLKRTRYLPDLMGDTLESYPRRVFIDVGLPDKKGGGSDTRWFSKNYPTRNLHFEMYKIETVTEERSMNEGPQVAEVGMSSWLSKNVKEEEYVVMKAEAEIVEEMVKSKVIRLVDELFLECRPSKGHGRSRPYWECLALYGRLRDEGVAVHQWWG